MNYKTLKATRDIHISFNGGFYGDIPLDISLKEGDIIKFNGKILMTDTCGYIDRDGNTLVEVECAIRRKWLIPSEEHSSYKLIKNKLLNILKVRKT